MAFLFLPVPGPSQQVETPSTIPPRPSPRTEVLTSFRAQALALVLAWAFAATLHLGNDGLWYQGDSPRHALNGFFWGDVVSALPADPKDYALRYYARYPAINPTSYPPFFYLLEGAAFRLVGPSPFVAKAIVQVFALGGGLFLLFWMRRWVGPEAGWAAVLLPLQPGFIRWSHAIMLNLPAAVLAFAATYYARRWTDHAVPRHLYLAAGASVLAVSTYFPAGFAVPAIFALMVAERRGRLLRSGRMMAMGIVAIALVIPLIFLVSDLAPTHFAQASLSNLGRLTSPETWTYYVRKAPKLLNVSMLVLIALSPLVALFDRRHRYEILLLSVVVFTLYVCLSIIWARDERYALLLVMPVFAIGATALVALARAAATRWGRLPAPTLAAVLAAVLVLHAVMAPAVPVSTARGFRDVASFFEENAPDARILYEGVYDGVFTFYVRAGDPGFRRTVVRSSKLLYSSAIFSQWNLTEYVSGPEEVVERLRTECGCEWIAIERRKKPDPIAAIAHLRAALAGPGFEHHATFPIESTETTAVDVYRMRIPFETPDTIELPFPLLGSGVLHRARPIER